MKSRSRSTVAPAEGSSVALASGKEVGAGRGESDIAPVEFSRILRSLRSPAELTAQPVGETQEKRVTTSADTPCRQAALPALFFVVLFATCMIAFFGLRSAEVASRRSDAALSFDFAEEYLEAALATLKRDVAGLRTTASVSVSSARNETFHWHSKERFLEAQRELTAHLQQIRTASPFIFGAAVIPLVPASDIGRTQSWGEEMLGLPQGSLALTQPSPSGVRTPPPQKDAYWVVVFHPDLRARASSAYLLDVEEADGRRELFNRTIKTGETVATPPTPLGALNSQSVKQQLLYQSSPLCTDGGLPSKPCGPETGKIVAINAVAFQHQALLDHSLKSEPYANDIAVRVLIHEEEVASHRWDAKTYGLHDDTKLIDAFDGVSWTVELRSTKPLLGNGASRLSMYLLAAGLFITCLLSATMLLFTHSLASAARDRIQYTKETLELQLSARRDALFDFLRTTSHDLRTPLHAISMSVEELRAEHPDAYNTAPIRIVKLNTQLLGGMISNVLDMDNISRGKLDLLQDSCDLSSLFGELVEMMGVVARDKSITLTYEPPESQLPFVVCDKMRILRCVQNVLGNAIKFTRRGGITLNVSAGMADSFPDGGPVMTDTSVPGSMASSSEISHASRGSSRSSLRSRLRRSRKQRPPQNPPTRIWEHPEFELLVHDPSSVCVTASVVDTGAGMTPSQMSRCVVPFQRAEAKHNGGSGLGLHVVLGVCLAYKGRLQVSSQVGKGTSFNMSFVLRTISSTDSEHSVASKRSSARSAAPVLPKCPDTRQGGHALGGFDRAVAPRVKQGEATPAPPKLSADSPCCVVVVDDQVTNAKLLKRQVERLVDLSSVEVVACFDGEDVVELAKARRQTGPGAQLAPIKMIFMDFSMPGMNGLEATQAIRKLWESSVASPSATAIRSDASPSGPFIVMLTANATTEDKTDAENAGCNAFQPKPCSVAAIRRLLQQAGLQY